MKRLVLPILSLLAALAFQSCEGLLPDSGGEDETISVTPRTTSLSSEEGKIWVDVKASGKWTLSLDFGADEEGWASLSAASGSGPKGDVRLSYEANEGEESRSVTLVLVSGSNTATATVEQAGSSASTGQYGYDVAPSSLDWLELPAMTAGDGRELLIHDMAGGKYKYKGVSGVRNWSCYYDYDSVTSIWVAYPLNKSLIGSGSRSDAWGLDPLLPASLQQQITSWVSGGRYYSDDDYDRGHQIPSADRYTPFSANASTFYATNMTPQEKNFNSGIWASLENKVRNYSYSADTLYVVTGCLIDDSVKYVKDSNTSANEVPVPTHYFKALLYRGSSGSAVVTSPTNSYDKYMAAGFLLPHDSGIANGNYLDYIMSIDKLEEETGIDFFPNLIKVLGKEKAEKVEAAEPSSWWK